MPSCRFILIVMNHDMKARYHSVAFVTDDFEIKKKVFAILCLEGRHVFIKIMALPRSIYAAIFLKKLMLAATASGISLICVPLRTLLVTGTEAPLARLSKSAF